MAKPASRKPSETLGLIRFSTYVEARALELGKGQRGERSRLKLMAAGARLLEATGYQELKIEDVCLEAGLAKGTFYIYFKSKDEFLVGLATDYFAFETNTLPRPARDLTRFGLTRLWIGWYERTFAANAGILRCVVQMGTTSIEMRQLWLERNGRLVDAIMTETMRGVDLDAKARAELFWSLRTIGGMLDQSLFDRYGLQTPSGLEDPGDVDLLIEMHSVLAYRALYGSEPPQAEVLLAGRLGQLAARLRP